MSEEKNKDLTPDTGAEDKATAEAKRKPTRRV
jgi:hypothetical protein